MSDDDVSDVEVDDDDLIDFEPNLNDSDVDDDAADANAADEDDSDDDDDASSDDGSDDDGAVVPDSIRRGAHVDNTAAQSATIRMVKVVADEDRVTSNQMTKEEVTRAIALRAQQITQSPNAYTNIDGLSRAEDIAQKELYDHRSPLVLTRVVGKTSTGQRIVEKWKVREMSLPPLN